MTLAMLTPKSVLVSVFVLFHFVPSVLFPTALALQDPETVVFEESFSGVLDKEWEWIREEPSRWCIRKGALEIRVMPGLANTVENALVRLFPKRADDETWAIEVTIANLNVPVQQYEQAGITWYSDDAPVFKLVKERVNGEIVIVPGMKPVEGDSVHLRLEVKGNQYTAKYRTDPTQPYVTAASGELRRGEKEQVSIQCYHGPPESEHWIRFDDFRILKFNK